jgi:hypothetical protein
MFLETYGTLEHREALFSVITHTSVVIYLLVAKLGNIVCLKSQGIGVICVAWKRFVLGPIVQLAPLVLSFPVLASKIVHVR